MESPIVDGARLEAFLNGNKVYDTETLWKSARPPLFTPKIKCIPKPFISSVTFVRTTRRHLDILQGCRSAFSVHTKVQV